jgi:hypothetical protein
LPEEILTRCTVGGPVFIHVKDGVFTLNRPIVFNGTDVYLGVIKLRRV